ncbi:MAG: NUDIX hydrolase [Candidatus Tectimicrobiota bacterium]
MSEPIPFEQRTEGVIVACQRADGRWLLIRRSATVRRPLAVCFPGGWIEPGETQEAAVVREMREELQAEVQPLHCVWQHLFGTPERTLWGWLATLYSPSLLPNPAEVHEVLWLTAAEAIHHPEVVPGTADFLASVLNRLQQPSAAGH